MQTILLVAEAIGSVVGSLAAAALFCWLLWEAFRVARRSEWTAVAVGVLLVLALLGRLPTSGFLNMAVMFAVVAAIPLWFAGRDWRKQHPNGLHGHHLAR